MLYPASWKKGVEILYFSQYLEKKGVKTAEPTY